MLLSTVLTTSLLVVWRAPVENSFVVMLPCKLDGILACIVAYDIMQQGCMQDLEFEVKSTN